MRGSQILAACLVIAAALSGCLSARAGLHLSGSDPSAVARAFADARVELQNTTDRSYVWSVKDVTEVAPDEPNARSRVKSYEVVAVGSPKTAGRSNTVEEEVDVDLFWRQSRGDWWVKRWAESETWGAE
jgi:hypothetical protein